jgi:hypothetical protein
MAMNSENMNIKRPSWLISKQYSDVPQKRLKITMKTHATSIWQRFQMLVEMRSKVLTVVNIETVVFWDVMPCTLVERYKCLRNLIPPASRYKKCSYPEDGGSRFLQNVGTHLPNYVASQGGKKKV